MGLNPSNGIAKRMHGSVFPNKAGSHSDTDDVLAAELEAAGIEVHREELYRDKLCGEVKTAVFGELGPWGFDRAWYYWRAEGPGIPPKYADKLYESHKSARVNGNCMCPSPRAQNKGFGIGSYHVDNVDGLKALADTIRQVMADNEAEATHD